MLAHLRHSAQPGGFGHGQAAVPVRLVALSLAVLAALPAGPAAA
jgi:hypothetical protein